MCHGDPGLTAERNGRTVSMFVNTNVLDKSVHKNVDCALCHKDAAVADYPHPERLAPVDCGSCHTEPAKRFYAGIHGQALRQGDTYAPDCKECHGTHDILSYTEPKSRTYKTNIPFLCGQCHREGSPVSRGYNISEHNIIENYTQGIHGEGLFKKGLIVTATCNNCHGNHMILPHTDPRSSVSVNNLAKTCMKCHTKIEEVHKKVIRGELWEKEPSAIPACNDCHRPHRVNVNLIEETIADKICLQCHQKKDIYKTVDGDTVSMHVNPVDLETSVHKNIPCAKCHTDVSSRFSRPCEKSGKVDCSNCHAEIFNLYFESGHGQAYYRKKDNAPYCTDCHGSHKTKSKEDENSPIYRTHIPVLCGNCHRKDGKANQIAKLKEVSAYSDYSRSVHGIGLIDKGLTVSAICTDCHTTHHVFKENDPRSSVYPENIPSTCAKCHEGIYKEYIVSIHAISREKESGDTLPSCVNCHAAHTISPSKQDKFMTEVTTQCGSCHKELSKTYLSTFHGKAYLLGDFNAARCSDCHGAHDVLKVSNPNSMVGANHIVNTCSKCHKGAGIRFTEYKTHATHHDDPAMNIAYWFMTILLISVFVFFGLHIMLWFPTSIRERKNVKRLRPEVETFYFRRFTRSQRITHLFVIISFLLLALTGMMLKFAYMDWAKTIAWIMGGVEGARRIHRFGALITFGYFGYHLFYLIRLKKLRRKSAGEFLFGKNSLMFNKQDLKDFAATIKWFFGKGPRPRYGRWTYWEKFDYMAVFWGVAVIGLSGLMLWFPVFFTKFLPGWVINIAQIIHSDEALLAVGFIFTVHFFNTHLRPEAFPMDMVIFTGYIPLESFKHERAREYEELKASGKLDKLVVKTKITREQWRAARIFGFIFLSIGISLIFLIVYTLIAG